MTTTPEDLHLMLQVVAMRLRKLDEPLDWRLISDNDLPHPYGCAEIGHSYEREWIADGATLCERVSLGAGNARDGCGWLVSFELTVTPIDRQAERGIRVTVDSLDYDRVLKRVQPWMMDATDSEVAAIKGWLTDLSTTPSLDAEALGRDPQRLTGESHSSRRRGAKSMTRE